MRGGIFGASLLGAAALGMAARAAPADTEHRPVETLGGGGEPPNPKKRAAPRIVPNRRRGEFSPIVNRNTGKRHEHKREIERAKRQATRNSERQYDRLRARGFEGPDVLEIGSGDVIGISRRGRMLTL